MPFEVLSPADAALATDDLSSDCNADATANVAARQLALRLGEAEALEVGPLMRRGKPSLQDIQAHITHLSTQLDTLRHQLRDHPADRLAILLREMIDERERALDRWIAQENRWDERLASIESAIAERDSYRRREAELLRERDTARQDAATAAARLEAAQRAADEEKRKAAALERMADKAQAEQLRLRQERELDSSAWSSERRQLAARVERLQTGWLGRLIRS